MVAGSNILRVFRLVADIPTRVLRVDDGEGTGNCDVDILFWQNK